MLNHPTLTNSNFRHNPNLVATPSATRGGYPSGQAVLPGLAEVRHVVAQFAHPLLQVADFWLLTPGLGRLPGLAKLRLAPLLCKNYGKGYTMGEKKSESINRSFGVLKKKRQRTLIAERKISVLRVDAATLGT